MHTFQAGTVIDVCAHPSIQPNGLVFVETDTHRLTLFPGYKGLLPLRRMTARAASVGGREIVSFFSDGQKTQHFEVAKLTPRTKSEFESRLAEHPQLKDRIAMIGLSYLGLHIFNISAFVSAIALDFSFTQSALGLIALLLIGQKVDQLFKNDKALWRSAKYVEWVGVEAKTK